MQHLRLAICGLSPFVSDIVRALTEDVASIEVVTSIEPSADLEADFVRSDADVMICSFPEEEMDRLWRSVVDSRPLVAVLNMVDDHRRARLHALYPHRQTVEVLTEETLVDALQRHLRCLTETTRS